MTHVSLPPRPQRSATSSRICKRRSAGSGRPLSRTRRPDYSGIVLTDFSAGGRCWTSARGPNAGGHTAIRRSSLEAGVPNGTTLYPPSTPPTLKLPEPRAQTFGPMATQAKAGTTMARVWTTMPKYEYHWGVCGRCSEESR